MKTRTVAWETCACGSKRGFSSEHDAEKALGRARTKRNREGDERGTRRGSHVESRSFECAEGNWHLTSESKRSYNNREMAVA